MPNETLAQALIRQARTHRSRGARRPVHHRPEVELADPNPDQLDMFTDAPTDEEH